MNEINENEVIINNDDSNLAIEQSDIKPFVGPTVFDNAKKASLKTFLSIFVGSRIGQAITLFILYGILIVYLVFFTELGSIDFSSIDNLDILEDLAIDYLPLVSLFLGISILLSDGSMYLSELLFTKKLPTYQRDKKTLSTKQWLLAISGSFGLWGLGVLIGNMPDFFATSSESVMSNLFPESWIMIIASVIIAPIFEELIYRKIPCDKLGMYGEVPIVFFSALCFGLAHGNVGQFFLAFFIGLLFACVYLKTNNIIYTMFLHFMINFTASVPNIISLIIGKPCGKAFNIVYYIVIIALSIWGIIMLIVNKNDPLLDIKRSHIRSIRRPIVNNVGFLLLTISYLVNFASFTLVQIIDYVLAGSYFSIILLVLVFALAILVTIFILKKIGINSCNDSY